MLNIRIRKTEEQRFRPYVVEFSIGFLPEHKLFMGLLSEADAHLTYKGVSLSSVQRAAISEIQRKLNETQAT